MMGPSDPSPIAMKLGMSQSEKNKAVVLKEFDTLFNKRDRTIDSELDRSCCWKMK